MIFFKKNFYLLLFIISSCFLFLSRQWGDTYYYAIDILNSKSITDPHLWEFGHLLWRPLGYLIYHTLLSASVIDSTNLVIIKILSYCSWGHAILLLVIFNRILENLGFSKRQVIFGSSIFVFYYPFLDYSISGTPYIAGLSWLLVGVYFDLKNKNKLLTSCSFLISVLFWAPYIFSLPAYFLIADAIRGNKSLFNRRNMLSGLSFIALCAFTFLTVAKIIGLESLEQFSLWMNSASHGKIGHGGITRTIYGFANSYFDLLDFGKQLKNILLGNSANISFKELISYKLFLLALFYFYLANVLAFSFKASKYFSLIYFVNLAINLLFAVYFDGGSTERYLSIFPLFIINILYILKKGNNYFRIITSLFFIILFFYTSYQNSKILLNAESDKILQRLDNIEERIERKDLVLVLNIADPLSARVKGFIYSWNEQICNYIILPVTDVGNISSKNWKEDILKRISQVKDQGNKIWISKRLLAENPQLSWGWVEGEDVNLSYQELSKFFNTFNKIYENDSTDGFVLIE